MSISSATLQHSLKVTELLSLGVDLAGSPTVTHQAADKNLTLNSSSSPAPTEVYGDQIALVAGAATINMAALTAAGGRTLDATGKKVMAIQLKNLSTTNPLTIGPGASNGYDLFGSTQTSTVRKNGSLGAYFGDALAAIASGARTLDIAGTGTDTFQILILFCD